MVNAVPRPRHATPRGGDRARGLGRVAVLAVLAVPSVLGAAAVVGGHGDAWRAAVAAAGPSPDPTTGAGVGAASTPSPTASPDPRPAASKAARSGNRAARLSSPGTGQVAAGSTAAVARVVGLGDSVLAGTNCGCTDYVQLLAQDIGRRQGTPVEGVNLAVAGLTTDGLLQQLDDADVRRAVAAADVVVVTVGANDLESAADPAACSLSGQDDAAAAQACYQDELAALAPDLDRIAARLAALPTAPGARVLVTGYWNVFLDGAAARTHGNTYVRVADAVTKAVNQRIAAAAAARGAGFVDLFAPFRGSDGSRDATPLLADDGDHPNAGGHRAIEKALVSAL
jgi:lysophospholipase L1-like esterase